MSRYSILVRSQFVTERSTSYSMVIVETAIAMGDFGHGFATLGDRSSSGKTKISISTRKGVNVYSVLSF
ncbi:MAG: hypothetical protein IM516_13130 [Pseudanabaena sp. M158S2SP1A06QC]|nr:hypothetical protein [Pseudanabaena sp. M172S2SP2A07QC]MCA6613020.1 hypothetical protein [Pseudanabaena sp. M158S2SP1A06QC]